LGQVAGDLGEAAEGAALVPQRRDQDVGPEPGAVLAQPPAFLLVLPGGGGDLQLPGRLAGLHVLRRVEPGGVLADDLLGGVALDALGAGVPTGDDALGVEQENGVVLNAFDQETEAFLAQAQWVGGGAACGPSSE